MHVETILKTKGRGVVTIMPEATLREAVQLLRRREIGALVVSRDGTTAEGILSERDVLHALADQPDGLLDREVSSLMARRVIACRLGDTIADLMALMTNRRIRHIPVLEEGRLCGMISIGDVVKNRLDEVEGEATSLREFIASA